VNAAAEPDVVWQPGEAELTTSRLAHYLRWLEQTHDLRFADYEAAWRWSVEHLEAFWGSVHQHFAIPGEGAVEPVLPERRMPGARWFPNRRLNFAEVVFAQRTADRPALVARSEWQPPRAVSWAELQADVAALAATFRRLGLARGDRVASLLPNRVETLVAFLACASLGLIWTSCSPDMGAGVVLDRLRQVEPRLLIASESYCYQGKLQRRAEVVDKLLAELPSVATLLHVPGPALAEGDATPAWRDRLDWASAVARRDAVLAIERLPFDHPLWIVYSSGTTGLPKPMVHGHGGVLITQIKSQALHHDLHAGERMLFLSSTGWIVWNVLICSLLVGAVPLLWDGHPGWPDADALWRWMDEERVTHFGCGAAFLVGAMKAGQRPNRVAGLAALRQVLVTGSPLPAEAFRWLVRDVKPGVWVASASGGTDVAAPFVSCCPLLPVRAGEIQCAELGVAAVAFGEAGETVVGEVGELVITEPMPSMPLFFWGDAEGRRYRESYFEMYPGRWRHGDWIRFASPGGSCVIYGRSDSTINRHGIRIGSAEIYNVVEALPEVADSLVIDLEYLGRPSELLLFVVLRHNPAVGATLDATLDERLRRAIREQTSPRHVPDRILAIAEVPRTLTGKKMEVPVRKLLLGAEATQVASPDAMANPASLGFFVDLASGRRA
jgi:acetoacetyl-CoA synthetase